MAEKKAVICTLCDNLFTTVSRNLKAVKYCPSCRKSAYVKQKLDHKRERREAPATFVWVVCEDGDCGNRFKSDTGKERLCPPCKKRHILISGRATQARRSSSNKEKAKPPDQKNYQPIQTQRLTGDRFVNACNRILAEG